MRVGQGMYQQKGVPWGTQMWEPPCRKLPVLHPCATSCLFPRKLRPQECDLEHPLSSGRGLSGLSLMASIEGHPLHISNHESDVASTISKHQPNLSNIALSSSWVSHLIYFFCYGICVTWPTCFTLLFC